MKAKLLAIITIVVVCLLCFLSITASAASVTFSGSEWTGKPHGFGINSENSRAYYYTYDSQKSALAGYTMYPEREDNSFYLSLNDLDKVNGAWRFHFAINPSQRPWPVTSPQVGVASRFLEADFDDSGWDHIAVPSNWQVNWVEGTTTLKYDKPNYKNTNYGWGNSMVYNGVTYSNSGMTNHSGTPIGVGTAQQAPQGYNSVGTHRRHFTVPANWKGRNITLNLDGVDGFYVWVNGVSIGYSDNTFAHKEFDITHALNFDGDNIIVVQVIRWTTGSWLEDQDFMRLSGIFRDIYLLARNKTDQVDLFDFEVKTTPTVANNYTGNWNLSITAFLRDWAETPTPGRDNATVYAQLFDLDGNPISEIISSSTGNFTTVTTDPASTTYTGWQIGQGFRNLSVQGARRTLNFTGLNVLPWSAEHPNLYKLVLRVGDVYTCIRVGFRHFSFTNESTSPRVFINGQRLLLHGTNAHEVNPYVGRALTEEMIREDLRIMKENNFNHVRMSHYIHNTKYYDICDEYGIYILDEANLETHQYRVITVTTNAAVWGQAIRDRMVTMYERDKNYASVWGWSLGNESGGGSGMAIWHRNWIKARDSLRPIHCEFENQNVPSGQTSTGLGDVLSYMYDSASSWNGRTGSRPTYLCEYSHGEGNSNGNYKEYLDVFESQLRTIGGAVWDWTDQSLWTPIPGRGAEYPAVGFMAVGGDWGDTSSDTWFIGDGVLFADRKPKESIAEMKYYNQMIRGTRTSNTNTSITYTIRNKNLFANVNEFDMEWNVTENGVVIKSGSGVQSVNPAPSSITAVKYSTTSYVTSFGEIENPKPGAEYIFNIRYKLREATLWAPAGFEIAREQFPLTITNTPAARILPVSEDFMTVTGTGGNISISGKDFSVSFSGGYINSYSYKGVQMISSGPRPNFYRGVTDNERAASNVETNMWSWNTTASTFTVGSVTVQRTDADNLVIVTVPSTWSTKNLTATTTYTIYPDGEVKVNTRYVFSGAPANSNEIPEIGTILTIRPGFENLTWYGRGPCDSYVDRRLGVHAGIYQNTVAENFVYYQRAQEMGTKTDTRWLTLTNDAGFGLMVKAGKFPPNNAFAGNSNAYNAANMIEFNALHFMPWELSRTGATGSSTSRRAYQVLALHANDATYETYLRLNLTSTGVGGDNTWGARPLGQYRININAARTLEYDYSLKPIDSNKDNIISDANEFWTSTRNFYQNLQEYMPVALTKGVPPSSVEYQNALAITTASSDIAVLNAYNALKALADSIKPSITSFKIGGYSGFINNDNDTIIVSLPSDFGSLASITPEIEVSMGATLVTTGALNFTSPVQVAVATTTSEKTYTVTALIAAAGERSIIGFKLAGAAGTISGLNIAVEVPYGSNLVDCVPEVYVSSGALYAPTGPVTFVPGVPFTFSVANASVSGTVDYSVTVTVAKSNECLIKSFRLLDYDGSYADGVIDGSNISVSVFPGTNLANVVPVIAVSDDAVYTPEGPVSFTIGTPRSFVVTADDGVTQRTYSVTVRNASLTLAKNVYAAYNTSGSASTTTPIVGLPSMVEVVSDTGKRAVLPATWNVSGAVFTTVSNGTVTVNGVSISGFRVEIIKPGTVAFINCGHASAGSAIYDEVKNFVGGQLINAVADRAFSTGSWGYQDGPSPNNAGMGMRAGAYNDDKYDNGHYGNNNSTGRYYRYFIDLQPGTYTAVCGLTEWWSGPRTTELTVRNSAGTVLQTATSAQVSSSTTRAIVNNANTPQSFTITTAQQVEVRFTAITQAQAPDVSWVQIYKRSGGFTASMAPVAAPENSVAYATTLSNLGGSAAVTNISVIVAVYDASGKMVGVTAPQVVSTLAVNGVTVITSRLDGIKTAPGYTAKAFIWDATTYVPLLPALTQRY